VKIDLEDERFAIRDYCGGISLKSAQEDVFRFGRDEVDQDDAARKAKERDDTLSVYGIGLKRAIFKIGNVIKILSAHPDGGFKLDLNVRDWERLPQKEWSFELEPYAGRLDGKYGTRIEIVELYDEINTRLNDGKFKGDLVSSIGRTYSYFLERVVRVKIGGETVEPRDIQFGDNTASESFKVGEVSCAVLAGIGVPRGKFYDGAVAGWYVYCNGRAVAFADRTELTGWGVYLPTFQPKFRPFLGLVFFTSDLPELLPWTTTKASINQESVVWQQALRVMATVGKQVTALLDQQYSSSGTDISREQLQEIAGKPVSALKLVTEQARAFRAVVPKRTTTSIQFDVKISDIDEVKSYLGKRSISNGAIGRIAFDHYLENVVRDE
jgi:hypothetical protein